MIDIFTRKETANAVLDIVQGEKYATVFD